MADYKAETEKGECVFCKIASGEWQPMGGGKFWENDKYLAWISPFQNTPGFSVLITKKHFSSDVLQMPDTDLKDFILEAKKVAKLMRDKLPGVGRVGLIMEGLGINHAHIKLVPMHGTDHLKKGEWKQIHSNIEDFYETYPGYISSHDSKRADDAEIKKLVDKLKG